MTIALPGVQGVRALASALAMLLLLAACRDRERGLTADSAVLQHRDSVAGQDTLPRDTLARDTLPRDTLADTLGIPVDSLPTLVLLADSVAGDTLFRRKGMCVTCHGMGGTGITGLGPDLTDGRWIHADGSRSSIQRIIREGVASPRESATPMPSLAATLTEAEVFRIAGYVYSLSHPGSVTSDTTRREMAGEPPPQ